MKDKKFEKQTILFLLNFFPALLIIIYELVSMITDVAWFIPLTMISIIVISILNIIFTDRDKHHRNAWMLILASAVAEVIVTAFHYFLISSDSETPVVGFLFCVLYGGLGLIFLLIGTWTNRYREYRKNLKDEK